MRQREYRIESQIPTLSGDILTSSGEGQVVTAQLTFNPSGTAPFIIGDDAADILVDGLNADLLDGLEASAFALASHTHDHGTALTGLGDDDHTQYALLAGRSGGQVLIGGTGSGENLTLQATAHATKGFILLDEADSDGTALKVDNDNRIIFGGTAGGANGGISFLDSGSSLRFALWFPGSNETAIGNRGTSGFVTIRANNAAGAGGEVSAITANYDKVNISVPTGINSATPGAMLDVTNNSASRIGQIIEAAAAQTANLLEINSNGVSGGDLVEVGATGAVIFNDGGADVDFRIEGSGAANAFFVQGSDGAVGIGTASPATYTEIEFTNTNVYAAATVPYGLKIQNLGEADGAVAGVSFQVENAAGSAGTGGISCISVPSATATRSADMIFQLRQTGTAKERMRIQYNGNVGIGTGSPLNQFHVEQTDATAYVASNEITGIRVSNTSHVAGAVAGILFDVENDSGQTAIGGLAAVAVPAATASQSAHLVFQTRNSGTVYEPMRIQYNGLVGINDSTPDAQLDVVANAASTVGLIVDAAASSSVDTQQWHYNGTEAVDLFTTAGGSAFRILARNMGNDLKGGQIQIQRNTNAGTEGPAAGSIMLEMASGGNRYYWTDGSGDLRIHTAGPTGSSGSPSVADNAGTVVGTQSSRREEKNIYGPGISPEDALQAILESDVFEFDYKSGRYNGEHFHGLVIENGDEWFAADNGKVLNPINTIGYLVQAVKALAKGKK